MELDLYISQYKGRTKIHRLLHIAATDPIEAYKLCLEAVKTETKDVSLYSEVYQLLQQHCQTNFDTEWVGRMHQECETQQKKLQEELRTSHLYGVRENIRVSCMELGQHYMSVGEIKAALDLFESARANSVSSQHLLDAYIETTQAMMKPGMNRDILAIAKQACGVAQGTSEFQETKARLLLGLCLYYHQEYEKALDEFTLLSMENVMEMNDVCSVNDVAIYSVLSALTCLDRKQTKEKLFSDQFKLFLETEPKMRQIITLFYEAKYQELVNLLDLKVYMDIYTNKNIQSRIKHHIILEYCKPYSCIDLNQMSIIFSENTSFLMNSLANEIIQQNLDFKIDYQNKTLVRNQIVSKEQIMQNLSTMGTEVLVDIKNSQVMRQIRCKLNE